MLKNKRNKEKRVTTAQLFKLKGFRRGMVAFVVVLFLAILGYWINLLGIVGVTFVIGIGMTLLLWFARHDILESRNE